MQSTNYSTSVKRSPIYLMKKAPFTHYFWFISLIIFGLTACVSRLDPKNRIADLTIKYQQMLLNDNSSDHEWHILIQQWQNIAENQIGNLAQESLWGAAVCWVALGQKNNNRVAISRSVQTLEEYTSSYPNSPHRVEAECFLGYYANKYNQPLVAIQHYQTIVQKHPNHPLTPFAKKDLIDIYTQQKNMTAVFQLYKSLQKSEVAFLANESREKLIIPSMDLPMIEIAPTKQPNYTTQITDQQSTTIEPKGKFILPSTQNFLEPEPSVIKVPVLPDLQQKPSLVEQLGLRVKSVVIDVGHGGRDPGAIGSFGPEKTIVLKVARLLSHHLEKLGYKTHLTRESDQAVSLKERTELVGRVSADLFLSLHANASEKSDAMGIETYYLALGSDETSKMVALRENAGMQQNLKELEGLITTILKGSKSQESQQLAETVQQQLIKRTTANNRGVKHAPFVVLTGTKVPAILIEIGFVTNPTEAIKLNNPKYQNQIAEAIAIGVDRYAKRALDSNN